METKLSKEHIDRIYSKTRSKFCFSFNSVGRGSGRAMLWSDDVALELSIILIAIFIHEFLGRRLERGVATHGVLQNAQH